MLSSIFRDSEKYVTRWVDQVATLQRVTGDPVHVVVAEGDSIDDTADVLAWALHGADFTSDLLTVNHGGPRFGPYDVEDRWAQIALVCNKVLDKVRSVINPNDEFVYVESDLVWSPDDIATLIADLDMFPAVAAMCMHGTTDKFYDTWGHRKNGVRFDRNPPYHPDLDSAGRFVEIDSAGSCFALRPRLATTVRFSSEDCILGIGRGVREAGEVLMLDREVEVVHPL